MPELTTWKLAMLGLLPLMGQRARLRTWVAMMGASIAAWLVTGPYAYLAIDILGAAIVLARPAGVAQRAIGAMFGIMCFFHLGFIVGGGHDVSTYIASNRLVGWAQWAVLLSWGGYDVLRPYRHRLRPRRHQVDRRAGAGG